jgi:oligopeptide transport system ATP-binding protein
MTVTAPSTSPVIELDGCSKVYAATRGISLRRVGDVRAVDDVSLRIQEGQTYSLVGESGCGKTTTGRLVLRIERPTGGTIRFRGSDIAKLDARGDRAYRSSVQAVLQDPWSSLNPRMRVRSIITEPLLAHHPDQAKEASSIAARLLLDVGLHESHADVFPHELSGGQRQRVAIARALSLRPALIVLDEPVSALDVSIRSQIMNLLRDLQDRYGMSYLLIAHDLSTVRYMSHEVGVMYLGRIVEHAPTRQLFARPQHPYTKALISATLPTHPDVERAYVPIVGEVPSAMAPPPGCTFHPRCPVAIDRCRVDIPPLEAKAPDHLAACFVAKGYDQ